MRDAQRGIYKALVAQYGPPTYPEHSGKATWKADGTVLVAYCQANVNCETSVSDRNFENLENAEQEEADKSVTGEGRAR